MAWRWEAGANGVRPCHPLPPATLPHLPPSRPHLAHEKASEGGAVPHQTPVGARPRPEMAVRRRRAPAIGRARGGTHGWRGAALIKPPPRTGGGGRRQPHAPDCVPGSCGALAIAPPAPRKPPPHRPARAGAAAGAPPSASRTASLAPARARASSSSANVFSPSSLAPPITHVGKPSTPAAAHSGARVTPWAM